jgi:hypothetical protein
MRALLAVLLFASSVFAQNQTPPTVPQSACGRAEVQYDVKKDQGQHIPEADPTKALVYVIQDQQTVGLCLKCTITTRIGLDGSWIGANNGGSYFFFTVDPGEHHLCANWQSRYGEVSRLIGLVGFTAEAGKTYYFRSRILYFGGTGDAPYLDFDAPNPDQAQYLISISPYSISHPKK